uniref:Uncharacterized protein n=1 Tax=Lepeophtheirus salmonis TaxID=72036 RepID=A0A0K2UEQ5_LEPSM
MINGSWLVGSRSRLVGGIFGFSRVGNISNIARVGISHGVGYSLETTIGESNGVRSLGGISITGLISSKVDSRVVILDSILVLVGSWDFIVGRSWLIGSRGWMVGSWVVSKSKSQESG